MARTVFYRHYTDLPHLAPDLLPDADAPLVGSVERVEAERPEDVVAAMVGALVGVFAEHGPLLRAIDDAARHDRAVAARLDEALVRPRALLERLLRDAAHPPPEPAETARMLMAAHRAYLLDVFGEGRAPRGARARATRSMTSMWERLLS